MATKIEECSNNLTYFILAVTITSRWTACHLDGLGGFTNRIIWEIERGLSLDIYISVFEINRLVIQFSLMRRKP